MRTSRLFPLIVLLCFGQPAAMAAQGNRCEWNKPGHDPYMGDLPSAVDHYIDIPVATRDRLKGRMRRLAYDDIATVRSDRIEGRLPYEPDIRDMHFGEGRTCAEVTRHAWPTGHAERGLVYCEDGFCVLVPFVCRNVSRIRQRPAGAPARPAPPPEPPVEVPQGASSTPYPPPWQTSSPLRPALLYSLYYPADPGPGFIPPSAQAASPSTPSAPTAPSATSTPTAALPAAAPPLPVPPSANPSAGPRASPPDLSEPVFSPPPPLAPVSAVPEPATGLLMAAGLVLLLAPVRRRRHR